MIHFACPTCQKVLKTPAHAAGRKTSCPKCGQRMLIPQPEKPAANNKTVLGQLTSSLPSPVSGPAAVDCSGADSLVLLGLKKDAECEGKSSNQPSYRPTGVWVGTAFVTLALILAIAAMPVAIVHHPLLGAGLAGLGVFFSALGLFMAAARRGAGCGLSLVSTSICGSILLAAILLYNREITPDNRHSGSDAPKLNYRDTGTSTMDTTEVPDSKSGDDEPKRTSRQARGTNAPKPRPRRHELEESPADRKSRRLPLFKTELDRIIEQLKSEKLEERIAAAEQLRKMGEKARPAARALCEAIVGPSESVRRAALEALEKADVSLYKQVVLLVVDGNVYNQAQASKALAAMGAEGAPAVPVLLSHAKKVSSANFFNFRYDLLLEDIAALAKLGPNEPEVVKLFVELTKYTSGTRHVRAAPSIRFAAFNALVGIAKSQPDRRKELMPMFIAAIDDNTIRIGAINALGDFGKDAKAAIPKLKDLKLSPSMPVREAARTALEKIDKTSEE